MSRRNTNYLDIKGKWIVPFDFEDGDLKRCFCYFLYKAPNIDSAAASHFDFTELNNIIIRTLFSAYKEKDITIKSKCTKKTFDYEGLLGDKIIKRKILCIEKKSNELDVNCLLRHLRNSIAHGRVCVIKETNKTWILFEDIKQTGSLSARILCNKKDILDWKKEIESRIHNH